MSEETTAVPTPHGAATPDDTSDKLQPDEDGTWGERDVGGPVNRNNAMSGFDELRRELTNQSVTRTQSRASTAKKQRTGLGLMKTITSRRTKRTKTRSTAGDESDDDVEAGQESEPAEDDDFDVGGFLKDGHFEKRTEAGESAKKVGVVYRNLTVKGVGASLAFSKTIPQAIAGTFGPDLYNLVCRFVPALRFGKHPPTRDLIHDFSGLVKDGEMMLVLGRPGSGCSTFLKTIANDRGSFAEVTGDVSYSGISAEEQRKRYKGEVNYNPEDDQHFPALTVWQTLRFALMNKTKKHQSDDIPIIIGALLKMFGITHTKETPVGNEYVRGVSGGERKRVSIAETLATKSTVVCWDNSTSKLPILFPLSGASNTHAYMVAYLEPRAV